MTTSPARTRGLHAPDPALFVAEVAPLDAHDEVPFAAAAATGHVVGGTARTVVALGSEAVLALPSGLADPEARRAVTTWLRSVERRSGAALAAPAVTAVGAFPFDPTSPATLVVPSTTWCVDQEGRGWRVDVRRRGGARTRASRRAPGDERLDRPSASMGPGRRPELTEVPSGQEYADSVARAVEDIASGRLRKVVLSRTVGVRLGRPASPTTVLERLWGADPALRPYSVPVGRGRMVGASFELLVARRGPEVVSHAFAGTVSLAGGDQAAVGRLLASAKDRDEHRVVVDAIAGALGPVCTHLDVPESPSVVRLPSDARLGSLLRGTLRDGETALELLGLVHPTPAVGGMPSGAALEMIAELEPPRGYWAGAVGWVDGAGDGSWVLAIRNAIVDGNRASVRAGAGIVAGSDPKSELAETTVKLSPVLEALWPGSSSLL